MKYLKAFETEAEYTAYKNGSYFVTPNVSYIRENGVIEYNKASLRYNTVDLGLPSGILWVDRNVGASSPEEAGLYFQWGDTVGYTAEQAFNGEKIFDWTSYFDTTDNGATFIKYSNDKLTALETSDDAVIANMGSEYRMPTKDEVDELRDNCSITFIDLQGNEYRYPEGPNDPTIDTNNLKGIRFASKVNSNSIFIPASGLCVENYLYEVNNCGRSWASGFDVGDRSSSAQSIHFDCYGCNLGVNEYRCYGFSIRGVK
jgi:hypothetical protein